MAMSIRKPKILVTMSAVALCSLACRSEDLTRSPGAVKVNPLREAYYGDLHLHTNYSFDAYLGGSTAIGPDEAYRFAKGKVVEYLGEPAKRREPLDFLAVTDHAENIGVFTELNDSRSEVSESEAGRAFKAVQAMIRSPEAKKDPKRVLGEQSFLQKYYALWRDFFLGPRNHLPDSMKSASAAAWARQIDSANRHYQPGTFTTFIGFEWTSMPFGANLHRNVIFKGGTAPHPFTAFDSRHPEDLWTWLETIRKQGFEALAIPHNSNGSNGLMYDWVASNTLPIDRNYAQRRQANEPLSEIAQIKGASETHPLLSANDEFAGYEIFDFMEALRRNPGRVQGSYLRDALSRGLALQRQVGVNPYKDGFVGGSDLHGGLSVSAQADFGGGGDINNVNLGGGKTGKEQTEVLLGSPALRRTSGSLTGVWAESNTRESIYEALRRRETFATTGTRLKFRFFGGWNLDSTLMHDRDWIAKAYARGVPMGGDLPARPEGAAAPTFAIWAAKDPNGANLDRVQVIKVWEEEGQQRERVFDVAWAGKRKRDATTGKVPAVGDTVDLKSGKYSSDIGASELKAVWEDPEFDPRRFAAYYIRVLEIPTPRWSTLRAIENGLPLPKDVPAITQQRGWSSPIWYMATGT
jgi:uncharacterized protein DUF3604